RHAIETFFLGVFLRSLQRDQVFVLGSSSFGGGGSYTIFVRAVCASPVLPDAEMTSPSFQARSAFPDHSRTRPRPATRPHETGNHPPRTFAVHYVFLRTIRSCNATFPESFLKCSKDLQHTVHISKW